MPRRGASLVGKPNIAAAALTPAPAYDGSMRTIKRIALAAGAVAAGLLYVWFAAVRAVPLVKRRKAMRRAGHR
jgi:hypothetical protein